MNQSQYFHDFKLTADQSFLKAQLRVAAVFWQGTEFEMDRAASARYDELAVDQRSVEAELMYVHCLLAGDGIETSTRHADRYLHLASSQRDVKATCDMELFWYPTNEASWTSIVQESSCDRLPHMIIWHSAC
jgi:hypothetical protein